MNTDEPPPVNPLEHVGGDLLAPAAALRLDHLQAGHVPNITLHVHLDVLQLDLDRKLVIGAADDVPAVHDQLITRYGARSRVNAGDIISLSPDGVHGHQIAFPEGVVEPRVGGEHRRLAVLVEMSEIIPQFGCEGIILLLDGGLQSLQQCLLVYERAFAV